MPSMSYLCASASLFIAAMSTPSGHSLLQALHMRHRSSDLVQPLVGQRRVRVAVATAP